MRCLLMLSFFSTLLQTEATILMLDDDVPGLVSFSTRLSSSDDDEEEESTAVTVSTLGSPSTDGNVAFTYNQWLGSSIISDPGAESMTVEEITIKFSNSVPNQHLFVGVVGSQGGRPDLNNIFVEMNTAPMNEAPLNTLTTLSLSPNPEATKQVLSPDETYWLVVGVTSLDLEQDSSAGLYHWSYANSAGPYDSGQGWRTGNQIATGNTQGQNWSVDTDTPYSFSITFQPIPESSTVLIFLLGIALIGLQRRNPFL